MNTVIHADSQKILNVSKRAYISYQEIYKGNAIVTFCLKLYGSFYGIGVEDAFNYYPLLGFIEALVYQTDEEVETYQSSGSTLSQDYPWNSKKKIIQSLLKELHLEHPTIENALEKLGEYFDFETQIMASDKITHADIIRACELRSADFRILHSILIQMLSKSYKAEVFDLMLPREVLLEIVDDIVSYRDDVASGHYNTYWMFERLYGEEGPYYLQVEIERYRNLFEERLKLFPEDEQKVYSVKWPRFWQRFPFLSSAELIRTVALQGDWKEE